MNRIKRKTSTIPFGYELNEEDGWLYPIKDQLDKLELAIQYLQAGSYELIATWLEQQTGRYISPKGLQKRAKRGVYLD